jgi:hypothetical protein
VEWISPIIDIATKHFSYQPHPGAQMMRIAPISRLSALPNCEKRLGRGHQPRHFDRHPHQYQLIALLNQIVLRLRHFGIAASHSDMP